MPMSDGDFNRALRQAARLKSKTSMAEAVLELYRTNRPTSLHVAYWEIIVDLTRRIASLERAQSASRAGYPGYD